LALPTEPPINFGGTKKILAARIIWSASSNPETLDNIEGLLTALAVLTIPVSAGISKIFEREDPKQK